MPLGLTIGEEELLGQGQLRAQLPKSPRTWSKKRRRVIKREAREVEEARGETECRRQRRVRKD